jgi:hypothetical protein
MSLSWAVDYFSQVIDAAEMRVEAGLRDLVAASTDAPVHGFLQALR